MIYQYISCWPLRCLFAKHYVKSIFQSNLNTTRLNLSQIYYTYLQNYFKAYLRVIDHCWEMEIEVGVKIELFKRQRFINDTKHQLFSTSSAFVYLLDNNKNIFWWRLSTVQKRGLKTKMPAWDKFVATKYGIKGNIRPRFVFAPFASVVPWTPLKNKRKWIRPCYLAIILL